MEQFQLNIAKSIYNALSDKDWIKAEYIFKCIDEHQETAEAYEDSTGKIKYDLGDYVDVFLEFSNLRAKMASQNANGHAWYTAVMVITSDGKFKFHFDYESLPAFSMIVPDAKLFRMEFEKFPRPELQAQVQDWMDGRVHDDDWQLICARLKALNKTKTAFSYDH